MLLLMQTGLGFTVAVIELHIRYICSLVFTVHNQAIRWVFLPRKFGVFHVITNRGFQNTFYFCRLMGLSPEANKTLGHLLRAILYSINVTPSYRHSFRNSKCIMG